MGNFWDAILEGWKAGRAAFNAKLDSGKLNQTPPPRSEKEYRAAIHEVGHALTAWVGNPYVTSIEKITFGPQGDGRVLYTRSGGIDTGKVDLLWCECVVNLGGIAAEMVHYKKTRSGPATRDLEQARDHAKRVVALGGVDNPPWDTEEVARLADSPFEVSKMLRSIPSGTPEALVLNRAYDRAKFLVMTNEILQVQLLEALLIHGTMGPPEVKSILGTRFFHLREVE